MLDKGNMTRFFRRMGWMHAIDRLKFIYLQTQNRSANKSYQRAHPEVVFPPDYMMFEAFNLDYERYYEGGRTSAEWLVNAMQRHTSLVKKDILDWGCGPGRIIRHLPDLIKTDCNFHGTDYNEKTIAWCQQNIPGISFAQNDLFPPTRYADNSFDIIYGISIFTHLSEPNHANWLTELLRIARPGALLLLTTQGNAFKERLTEAENEQFDRHELVIRGQVVEGHRVFSAFHPPEHMRNLFSQKATVLQLVAGEKKDWGIEQDLWILQKQ